MATEPTQMADGGAVEGLPAGPDRAGTGGGMDATLEPGNYGPSLFGVALPQGTGAGGSDGAYGSMAADATNEPGQTSEGFTGLGPDAIADTGAPGSGGAAEGAGGDAITYTDPGSFLGGTNKAEVAHADVSGPDDWTQGVNGYSTPGNLPGIDGNTPTTTGAGAGRVLRGGRAVS